MKKIILIMLAGIISGCIAAINPVNIELVKNATYQRIIESPGKTKEELFEKSRQWFASTFISSKKVIEYENGAEGKIIGNGSDRIFLDFGFGPPVQYGVKYLMTEEIKDGKIRLTFNKIHIVNGYGDYYSEIYVDGWKQLQPKLVILSESLESFINKPATAATW